MWSSIMAGPRKPGEAYYILLLLLLSISVNYYLVHLEAIAFGTGLCFTQDVCLFFSPTRDLRDASADWREILHDYQQ